MSTTSKIEWTDKTWNPVVGWRLTDPFRWRKPCRIFVNSMSDLFHKDVPFEFIDRVFAAMALNPQHTFQILTKRPERMSVYLAAQRPMCLHESPPGIYAQASGPTHPLPNVWLGTSCEDQATADERIPHLLRCPAAVRFLSIEPLLRPVELPPNSCWRLVSLMMIHWVIVGGESGPGARPMHPNWVRSIRDQCWAAGVPFFFKQRGEWIADECMFLNQQHWINKAQTWVRGGTCIDSLGKVMLRRADFAIGKYPVAIMRRVGKKVAGAMLDGREWREWPQE